MHAHLGIYSRANEVLKKEQVASSLSLAWQIGVFKAMVLTPDVDGDDHFLVASYRKSCPFTIFYTHTQTNFPEKQLCQPNQLKVWTEQTPE